MKRALVAFLGFLLCVSCTDDTFKSYDYGFFSIAKGRYFWEESKFLSGDTIAFQINSSNILEDYHSFEPIKEHSVELSMNDFFVINEDMIGRNENLIEAIKLVNPNMISFAHQPSNNSVENHFYYLIIQSTTTSKINMKDGYYTFYFNAETVSGFEISDSTIVK